ncbi:MAG: N-acetylglutamate synthase [Acidobacteriia bacterium 12-62-4]|jgi:amino-acid N-acetyltransferase|nr:MAG: N-acetylglutamate synthase [Acidobacteriia bacterium 12-62-4]
MSGPLISIATPRVAQPSVYTEGPTELRKATLRDIGPLLGLINDYAAQGIMLPRTEFEMAENIRDFTVIYGGSRLVACAALHIYSPLAAEIRSLAVDPGWKKHGLGRQLLEAVEIEAREFGLKTLFAFTYVDGFFRKLGYDVVDRGELPLKAWKDCLRCPKFQACDEIAMLKQLG